MSPTYEYVCQNCNHRTEFFQKITEGPKRKCGHCGKLTLKRQIGFGGGVIFKGTPGSSGFHALDYRKSNESDNKKDD